MTPEEKTRLLEEAATKLRDHFDNVRIFCNGQTEDGNADTERCTTGSGNFFAQLGQVVEWVEYQKEIERHRARNDFEEDES